jgi:hypothetical protein
MTRVPRERPLTKGVFHQRLKEWLQNTDEETIGSEGVDGRTSWIHVRDGLQLFVLHADTSREAVEWYLRVVEEEGDSLQWEIAASQRGKMTAVVFGPRRLRRTSLYLYAATDAV